MGDEEPEDRLEAALGDWLERRERGETDATDEVIRAHPDLAGDLQAHFEALRSVDQVLAAGDPPTFSEFRILRELGRGGMGIVYEAEQLSMRRIVALKLLHPAVVLDPHAVERFRREAQAAGRIHHTNVVPVYAMGQEGGRWYYAMELVRGRTLAEICSDLRRLGAGAPPAPATPSTGGLGSSSGGLEFYLRVARAFAGVADALHAAHLANVIHRDVKPSNLILDTADDTLKITDFGLARMDGELPTMTLAGATVGTPAYMSPEQIRSGERQLTSRTDVYGLGATLYEVLTLRPPFQGRVEEVLEKILRGSPPPPRAFERRIPRDLETIALKAMEVDPERRYRTAADMARDLRFFAEGAAIHARRRGPALRLWRRVRKHRRLVASAGAVLLVGVLALWALAQGGVERERRIDLQYDDTIRSTVATILDQGRFTNGRLIQLADRWNRELRENLAQVAALRSHRAEARLLPALLPETPIEEHLADLDSAHREGLGDAAWHWARAYAGLHGRPPPTHCPEFPADAVLDPEPDRIAALLRCCVLGQCGDRRTALQGLDDLLIGPPDAIERPLALMARAFLREQEGDAVGALEDYAALESQIGISWPMVRMRMATLWLRLGRTEHAKACFEETLYAVRRTEREDAAAYIGLCEGCRQGHLPAEWCQRATAAAMEDRPSFPEVLVERARYLRSLPAPDLEEVASLLTRALEAGTGAPGRVERLVELAEVRLQQARPQVALRACENALLIDGRDAWASAMKARALVALDLKEEGKALARETSLRDPSHRTLHHCAIALDLGGDAESGLAMFMRAAALDPSCRSCAHATAVLLSRAGRWSDVERVCRDALARFPDAAEFLYLLTDALDVAGKFDEVVDIQRRLTRLEPEDPINWNNLADSLNRVRRFEEGLAAIRRARELHLGGVPVHRVAAESLAGLGRIDQAIAELESVIAVGEDEVSVWLDAGKILRDAGRLGAARDILQRGIQRFPKEKRLRLALGVALSRLGQVEPALAVLREVLDIDAQDAEAWGNAALLEERLGAIDKAIDTAKEGLRRTDDPQVRWVLGCILQRQRTQVEAREAWLPLFLEAPNDLQALRLGGLALGLSGTVPEAVHFLEVVRARWGTVAGCTQADKIGVAWRRAGREADARALAIQAVAWPGIEGERAARLLAVAGREGEAANILPTLPTPTSGPAAFSRASLCALLVRRDDAIYWLDRAILEGFHDGVTTDPDFAVYAKDPEIQSRLERISRRP